MPIIILSANWKRIYAAGLALAGWCALALQCYWAIETGVARGLSTAMSVWNVLSYFTILTNILIAALLTMSAVRPDSIRSPGLQTALASYILIVGFVYELALRRLWNPEGLHFAVDVVLHYVVPLGYFAYWLLFVEKSKLRYRSVARWTLYPFAYLFYSSLRGQLYGFFPYPFLNYVEIGWLRFAANVSLLVLVFVAAGLLLVALNRAIAKRLATAYR